MILLYRNHNGKVFASRLGSEIEELVEPGQEQEILLDDEGWEKWQEVDWYPYEWELLEEAIP